MKLYYPGSFKPLHLGHIAVIRHAELYFSSECMLEMCERAYDKEGAVNVEFYQRQQSLEKLGFQVHVTPFPAFIQKARYFREQTRLEMRFIVGFDTFERLVNPKYYDDNEFLRNRALSLIYKLDTKFAVYPRPIKGEMGMVDDVLDSLNVQFYEKRLFIDMSKVKPAYIPVEMSSTELRSKGKV